MYYDGSIIMFSYERFESICKSKGYTPSGLCVAIGRSKSLASKWKNENGGPNTEILCQIAEELGVSTDYILGLTEIEKPATESDGMDNLTDNQKILVNLIPRLADHEVLLLISQVKGIILGQ